MKNDVFCHIAAALLTLVALPGFGQFRSGRNYNLTVNNSNAADRCSDLRVTSSNGVVAQVAESATLGPGELSALKLEDNAGRSVVQVRGWDRAEYQVETCKIVVAETQGNAEAIARGITVSRSAGRVTTFGPSVTDGNWQVYFLVRAPRNANLDLTTQYGPIGVEGVSGDTKVRAVNGPLALKDVGGQVDAQTQNGPISFSGRGGNVKLTAQNGPISLELMGDQWNGQQLEAKTVNGPVSITIPENYRSGVRLQTAGHAPLSCNLPGCRNAATDLRHFGSRTIQLNGSADTVRVSTSNGPVSVTYLGPGPRVI
jgi:hypothetical protein